MRNYNVLWLLMIILIPFATRLLTMSGQSSAGAQALQFGFYALLQVLSSAALLLTVHRVTARGLQTPDTPPLTNTHGGLESYGIMLGFGASIPLFLVTTNAWVIWIAGPLLVGQLGRLRDGAAARAILRPADPPGDCYRPCGSAALSVATTWS